MDPEEFRRRLDRGRGSALTCWPGILPDFALSFAKRSSLDARVGYATVESAPGQRVEGVVYEISAAELAVLDRIELVPDHYTRLPHTVAVADLDGALLAECYVATPAWYAKGLLPTRAYIARMRKAGAMLSEDYARALAAQKTIEQENNALVA